LYTVKSDTFYTQSSASLTSRSDTDSYTQLHAHVHTYIVEDYTLFDTHKARHAHVGQ